MVCCSEICVNQKHVPVLEHFQSSKKNLGKMQVCTKRLEYWKNREEVKKEVQQEARIGLDWTMGLLILFLAPESMLGGSKTPQDYDRKAN